MEKTAIRIFISSTFKDLETEREMLVKGVFPKVKSYAEKQGLSLYFVDLRWGIATYESLEIIKACLDEIDNCAPFFIGIIGNRYGYIPPSIAGLDLNDIEQYKGKSITEMEMVYGVFNRIEKNHSIFAIKKDEPISEMIKLNIADSNEYLVKENINKLNELKTKAKTYCNQFDIPCYENYTDINDLCDFFYDELIKLIDSIVSDIGDILEFKQTNYLNKTLDNVYKNNYMFEYITKAINSDYNKILIYDKNYSGKTTLLSHYAFLQKNKIIINLAADLSLHNIDNLYLYLSKKLNLNYGDINYVNSYIRDYKGEKLYIVINDLNLLSDIDNSHLLLSLPKDVSKDIVMLVSTNDYQQLSSLTVLNYFCIPNKSFDSFIFAEEQMIYQCHKYGKNLSEDIRKFLRTSPLCRDFSTAKVVLDYFIHESNIEKFNFIKQCQTLEDFYYCLIDFNRSQNAFLSYLILAILKIYNTTIDLDNLYDIIEKINGKENKAFDINHFTFNKAINNIHSLITYYEGKIALKNNIVKKALSKNIEKNSKPFYNELKEILKYTLGLRFAECAQNNLEVNQQELRVLYNHFFSFYYDLFVKGKLDYNTLHTLILNETIVKYIAKNKLYFWSNQIKQIYNIALEHIVKNKTHEYLLFNLTKNKEFNHDELHFIYITLINLSQYKEADELNKQFKLFTERTNNFEEMFELISTMMNGSQLEYIVEMIKVLEYDKYTYQENKRILQKILLFYFYLEEKEVLKKYLNIYKDYVSKQDEVTLFFEGYFEENLNLSLAYFNTSLALAEIINNEEMESLSIFEICRIKLIAGEININQFYEDISAVVLANQALLINSTHITYKYYQYISTYCSKYFDKLIEKDKFTAVLDDIKNRNFQKIVKISGEIALHKLTNGEIDYVSIFEELYMKELFYSKLILNILKELKD